ncbi:Zinc finger, CCHC-type superfamily, partial [Sesbania bispinosa]
MIPTAEEPPPSDPEAVGAPPPTTAARTATTFCAVPCIYSYPPTMSAVAPVSNAAAVTNVPLIPCDKLIKDIPTKDQSRWKQIDASLCSVLWFSIDAKLQAQYQSFKTCYDVWTKAKKVYSNDINRLYTVVSNLISVKKQDMDMQSYLSKLDSLIADFDSLMPFTDNADEHAKQRGKFFIVLALAGLPYDLDSVCNQILSSPTIPSYDTVCEQLLWLSVPQSFAPSASASFLVSNDSTTLVSNSYHCGGRGGRGGYRIRPWCNYCKRFGHVEEQCRTKANQQQPKILNVAQFAASGTSDQVSLSTEEYDEYIRLKAAMQPTTPVAFVAHT